MHGSVAQLSSQNTSLLRRWLPAAAVLLASLCLPHWLMITMLASIAPNVIAAALMEEAPYRLPLGVAALLTAAMTILPTVTWSEVLGALAIQTYVFLAIFAEKLLFGGGRVLQAFLGLVMSLAAMGIVRWVAVP